MPIFISLLLRKLTIRFSGNNNGLIFGNQFLITCYTKRLPTRVSIHLDSQICNVPLCPRLYVGSMAHDEGYNLLLGSPSTLATLILGDSREKMSLAGDTPTPYPAFPRSARWGKFTGLFPSFLLFTLICLPWTPT